MTLWAETEMARRVIIPLSLDDDDVRAIIDGDTLEFIIAGTWEIHISRQ